MAVFAIGSAPAYRPILYNRNPTRPTMLITSFNLERVLSFLEPYLLGNLLASEWQCPESKCYPYVVHQQEAYQLGFELQRRFGFEPEPKWGVCKVVYLHRTAVIKIPIHECFAPYTTQEVDDINRRWPDPYDRVHFPYTIGVGDGIAVQERCRVSEQECLARKKEINALARSLQLWDVYDPDLDEVREDNVGFELHGAVIKFFDVQRREQLKEISGIQSTRERLREMQLAGVGCLVVVDK